VTTAIMLDLFLSDCMTAATPSPSCRAQGITNMYVTHTTTPKV